MVSIYHCLKVCFSSGQQYILDFKLFLTLTVTEMSGPKTMLMCETETMRIRFIPRGSCLDFKFNSEFVALAVNTSP